MRLHHNIRPLSLFLTLPKGVPFPNLRQDPLPYLVNLGPFPNFRNPMSSKYHRFAYFLELGIFAGWCS